MRIAVVNEGSTKHRNADVLAALAGFPHEVINLGMRNEEGEPALSYMETALISALALNLGVADMVVGGCGTGQGYMNAVLQYPGVACGLLMDPTEAFLFAKVNAGNCISLQLNKGYGGIGGDVNLRYMFQQVFADGYGEGYPVARAEIQQQARLLLEGLSVTAHRPMAEILQLANPAFVSKALSFPGVMECFRNAPESELRQAVLDTYSRVCG